jgi:serine/threonine protein phosphatase 1
MFSKLFSKKPASTEPHGHAPDGLRLYAVGDIHGRVDLLDDLLAQIHADEARRGPAETHLIFLGDLVDRGPTSAQVIDRLIALEQSRPRVRFLMGNHEEVYLKAIKGDLAALKFFVKIGGRETILSYGIDEESYRDADFEELLALWQARVPAEHIAFLDRFEDLIIFGDYAFVHAGVHPARSFDDQRATDLRWIRDTFLDHRTRLEKVVVHGHTITDAVEFKPHRIGTDTGAYMSGRLSALGLELGDTWVIDTAS